MHPKIVYPKFHATTATLTYVGGWGKVNEITTL